MADEFIKRDTAYNYLTEYYNHRTDIQHQNLRKALSAIPSADVVEVKHGEWIEMRDPWGDDPYYNCSCCNDAFVLLEGTPKDNNYNFCPNCGADMRGET